MFCTKRRLVVFHSSKDFPPQLAHSPFFQQPIFLRAFPTTSEACQKTLIGKASTGVSIKRSFDGDVKLVMFERLDGE